MAIIRSIFEQAGISIPSNIFNRKINTVFKETGLDWRVIQSAVYSDIGAIPNAVANYRSDNNQFLGFVNPKNYKVVQNIEAFDFVDELTDFTLEKVGMFNGGKKVFVVGKSTEQLDINGQGDVIDLYFTFLHGHDGKSGIRFIISPIRMFCMNQLNLMLEKATFKYNITHTGNVELKLEQIKRAINNSHKYVHALEDTISDMINSKPIMSIEEFVDILIGENEEDSTRIANRKVEIQEAIVNLYNNKDDLQNYKGTKFGYLNAVSDFVSHAEPLRKVGEDTIDNMFIKNIEGNELIEQAKKILLAA